MVSGEDLPVGTPPPGSEPSGSDSKTKTWSRNRPLLETDVQAFENCCVSYSQELAFIHLLAFSVEEISSIPG